ncbi:MAG: dienelactone hydrolase family protein [Betaproteobacteria bacterium]|nr:dienelactone hydrolase family protein [Betaproteobacteria bacterium]
MLRRFARCFARLSSRVLFTCLATALTQTAAAQDAAGIAARTELHPIPSVTISDGQFLKGDAYGRPVTVAGVLRFPPRPVSPRPPVVVLVHGSSGIGANIDFWSNRFLASGYATFAIDGFTGRGLTATGPDQGLLGRLNLIVDAYRALELLASHPRIDRDRVVLMGFSRGGQATLFAANKRFDALWNRSGARYAAFIPFYADCGTTYLRDAETTGAPIRLHHGRTDDYNPIASCRAYVQRLKDARQDVALFEYENGPHGFDSPIAPAAPVVSPRSQTVRNCRIVERSEGVLINEATGHPFQYTDACVERDPHVGGDREATAKAAAEIDRFLQQVFKPR